MPNFAEETTGRCEDVVRSRKGSIPPTVMRKTSGRWTRAKNYGTTVGLHLLGLLLYSQPYFVFLAAGAGFGYLAGFTSTGTLLGGGISCFLYFFMTF